MVKRQFIVAVLAAVAVITTVAMSPAVLVAWLIPLVIGALVGGGVFVLGSRARQRTNSLPQEPTNDSPEHKPSLVRMLQIPVDAVRVDAFTLSIVANAAKTTWQKVCRIARFRRVIDAALAIMIVGTASAIVVAILRIGLGINLFRAVAP